MAIYHSFNTCFTQDIKMARPGGHFPTVMSTRLQNGTFFYISVYLPRKPNHIRQCGNIPLNIFCTFGDI